MPSTVLASIPDEILTVYSREAILAAEPWYVFRNFVDKKVQLGIEPGRTIQFLKLANLAGGGQLASEFDPIPRQSMSESQVSITVYEFANAVQFSRYAAESAFRDLMSDSAVLLGRNYAKVLDDYLRDIFLGTSNVQYAGGAANDGAITTASVFNTSEIKDAVETLKTANVPPMLRGSDAHYVAVVHPFWGLSTVKLIEKFREIRERLSAFIEGLFQPSLCVA